MKREIKFRVWFAEQKRIIYLGSVKNDTALWLEERGWDAVDHLAGNPLSICSNYNNENTENILMQFTNIIDKGGREIFEGDILRDTLDDAMEKMWFTEIYCPVIFRDGAFGYLGEITGQFHAFYEDGKMEWEVVGNIYESSELLNKNNERE